MSRKRENVFIGRVHLHLPSAIYAEKTHNRYRGGTADCYYDAPGGNVMWIEYKWLDKIPEQLDALAIKGFTKLQQRWLRERHERGIKVALVIGSPQGTAVLPGISWMKPCKVELLTFEEVITWLSTSMCVQKKT